MGSEKFDGEDEIHPNMGVRKRFKFPKKFFDECYGVDHSSVPRKLRSAIKKRGRQSISPLSLVSKKTTSGEALKKDVNKCKRNLTQCGLSRCGKELEGPITKDEEEVAETLYALAGMIPEPKPEAKSLALTEPETSPIANRVVKDEQEIRKASSQLDAGASKRIPDAAVSAGEAAKSQSCGDDSTCDASTKIEQLENSLHPVVAVEYQANEQSTIKEKRKGSLLWPGLSAVGSFCSDTIASSPQIPLAKFPAWFGSMEADAPAQNTESCLPTVKDSKVTLDLKKSWKSCAAHVHISRLIKDLKSKVREDTISSHLSQPSCHDGLKQGTHVMQNGLTGKMNDMTGIASTADKNPTEIRNAILLHKRLLQDQQQTSTTSGFDSLIKQNIDFLSLSTGSYGMKGSNSANFVVGRNLEALPTSQNHPALHFLLPQNAYSSTSSRFHPPAAVAAQQILLPRYLGGASNHPSPETTMTLPRQPSQHNELQNAHFTAAQYQYGVSSSQMRDWQNAARHPPMFEPSLPQLPPSTKYAPTLLNEQELMSITSSSRAASRIRGQYYNFPSGLEGNRHGIYTNKVPSIQQLLCNDNR